MNHVSPVGGDKPPAGEATPNPPRMGFFHVFFLLY